MKLNDLFAWRLASMTLLLASMASPSAQAQYTWTTNADNTITITSYTGSGGALTIPDALDNLPVTVIGNNAFQYATLTSVTIPNSVTSIGDLAFYGSLLTNVTLGDAITNIGSEALDCPLTAINVNSNNSFYSSTNGVLFDKGQTTLILYPSGLTGNYSIPVGVTSIADDAFEFCNLTGVTIPNSITNLGTGAFSGSGLTSVTIPGSVSNIGRDTFYSCMSLTNVTIGDGVTNIDTGAFLACFYLETVTIPASIASIGNMAFGDCDYLTSVFFEGNAPSIFALQQYAGSPGYLSFYHDDFVTAYYLPDTTGWPLNYVWYDPGSGDILGRIQSILWNPVIQTGDSSVQNGQFGFNITGPAEIPVAVEACTDLANPVWTPLATMTLTNGSVYFSEPVQTNTPARFYRIRIGSP